ncbi:hypothetical protein [Streptomyces natalensis]|uniref:Uncharacterized protein n=1 Tax=Streptomyces natalensis ATCC 27448 TaxID=1240678 RepID=A0A0D7CCE5_9ACTN|nr:hypothetical protein [Streptomyces natalensis]KIZ13701.1 hypothetical protein SNA_37495 [Streptomyces natalensis ATCC 27448]
MTTQTAKTQGSHHWVMTVELPGRAMQTLYGTWTPPQGTTRHDVFLDIKAEIAAEDPDMARANVVFFSLEPNQL